MVVGINFYEKGGGTNYMDYDKKTKSIVIENCHECPFLITRSKYVWSGWEGYCELYDIVADELIDFEIKSEKYIWHKCPLKKKSYTFTVKKEN